MNWLAQKANQVIGNVPKAKLMVGKQEGTDKYKATMEVKYNPSSIRLSARAGTYRKPGVGQGGFNQTDQSSVPAQATMNVELIFDDVNPQDAFMLTKFTSINVGSMVSNVGGIVKQLTKGGYSVQPQVEGLIALITSKDSREIQFCWDKMMFAGEVINVSANYTMFNPVGNPIRARVGLTIQKVDADESKTQKKYWDDAFTEMFGTSNADKSIDSNLKRDFLTNFLNL